jgi:hypothetical protein
MTSRTIYLLLGNTDYQVRTTKLRGKFGFIHIAEKYVHGTIEVGRFFPDGFRYVIEPTVAGRLVRSLINFSASPYPPVLVCADCGQPGKQFVLEFSGIGWIYCGNCEVG